MGSKRPVDDPNKTPYGRLSKRCKTHEAAGGLQHGKPAAEDRSQDCRLSALKSLVQDMIDDSNIPGATPEVMEAISLLDAALRRSSKNPSPTQNPPLQHEHLSGPSNQASHSMNSQTPPLPPISDFQLEKAVFTHPANANDHNANYDRLEILGDAYIELIATKMVWERFPGLPSGRISQIRELLVKNETLSRFAEIYQFDRKALVPANYSDQAKRWTKTKGDIFEAYVAAVVLSHPTSGYEIVEKWLTTLWQPSLSGLGHQKVGLHSKEELAKKVMGKGVKLEYIEEQPSVHKKGTGTQTFFIGVYLTGWGWAKKHLGSGQGSSKTVAGDEAARDALQDTALVSEIATVRDALIHRK